jgi:hypothetical protein
MADAQVPLLGNRVKVESNTNQEASPKLTEVHGEVIELLESYLSAPSIDGLRVILLIHAPVGAETQVQ